MMVNSQSSPRWLVCKQNIDTRKPESWNCVQYTFSPYFPVIGAFEHTEHHLLFLEASCENKPPELSHIPVISLFNAKLLSKREVHLYFKVLVMKGKLYISWNSNFDLPQLSTPENRNHLKLTLVDQKSPWTDGSKCCLLTRGCNI